MALAGNPWNELCTFDQDLFCWRRFSVDFCYSDKIRIHVSAALHYIALHYITLRYVTLHYITLHYITLHYITLHYITLHYITN